MKRIIILLLLTIIYVAHPKGAEAAASFSVSPAFLEIHTIDETEQAIQITNTSDEELTLSYQLLPFTQNAQKPSQMQFLSLDSTYTKLFSHIVLSNKNDSQPITLPPRSQKTLSFNIKVDQVPPSTYTFVFLFSATQPQEDTDVTLSKIQTSIAIPTILTTSKEIKGHLNLLSFHVPQFQFTSPVPMTVTVRNENSPATPVQASISIKNVRNQEIERIEFPTQYLFPGVTRTLSSNKEGSALWKPRFALGIYTAELHLKTPTQAMVQRQVFFVLPRWLFITFISVAFIAAGVYLRVKKYR